MSKNALGSPALASVLACILSSTVLLGSSAGPPLVDISVVNTAEDGARVKVLGVLVSLKIYDSGAEGMTLADLEDGSVVRIVCSPLINPQPSTYARVGDEMLVEGAVSQSETGLVIFAGSDDVKVLRESERVLTVRTVSENWVLFEGDMIRVKGILRITESGTGLRLRDPSDAFSIAVLQNKVGAERFVGSTVTLTAMLLFDHSFSALVLVPSYVVVAE